MKKRRFSPFCTNNSISKTLLVFCIEFSNSLSIFQKSELCQMSFAKQIVKTKLAHALVNHDCHRI